MNLLKIFFVSTIYLFSSISLFTQENPVFEKCFDLNDTIIEEGSVYPLPFKFDIDKALLKPEMMTELDKLVDFLKKHHHSKFVIEGYSFEKRNTSEYSYHPSKRRYESIMFYLINKGIKREQLKYLLSNKSNQIMTCGEIQQKDYDILLIVRKIENPDFEKCFELTDTILEEGSVYVLPFKFDTDKRELKKEYWGILDSLANFLTNRPNLSLIIEHHDLGIRRCWSNECCNCLPSNRKESSMFYLMNKNVKRRRFGELILDSYPKINCLDYKREEYDMIMIVRILE